jgi:putative ABC transport system permease protein
VPSRPFQYSFLDEAFDAEYRAEERLGTLFGAFAGLAVLIACLGLFGLMAFTAARRRKEIGVRKVLGASVANIVVLLSTNFLKPIGVAFLIATPLTYLAMQRWLEGFAYSLEIGPGVFLLTGGLVLLIAIMTIGYQSIKTALANPVKSLRYE